MRMSIRLRAAGRAASALKRPFAPTVVSVRTGVSFKAKCSGGRLTHLGDEQVGEQ